MPKNQKILFGRGLEDIEFECGEPLFRIGEKEYQKVFAEHVITNQKLDCESPVETVYHSRNFGNTLCYKCGDDLSSETL